MRRALLLLTILTGCSWSQFDTFGKDTPVTAFTNRSFGAGVAIATDKDGTAVLTTAGNPGEGARAYPLLDGRSEPSTTPITNNAACELNADTASAGKPCLSAAIPIGIGTLVDPKTGAHPGCFALGYGKVGDAAELTAGPEVFCTDAFLFTLGSAPMESAIGTAFASRTVDAIKAQKIALAALPAVAGASDNPPLVLGVENDEAAFVYARIVAGEKPKPLVGASTTKGDRFGASVAIAKYADAPVYFVAAPSIGKIFAYTNGATSDADAVHLGCMSGDTGLGDTLTVGDVDGDGAPDVLAREKDAVKIFLGKDRPTSAAASECANDWPASSIVLRCSETRGASDCANGDFGRAIAVGDLDGDGKSEVAVGAPYVATDGTAGSGAVFLYTPSVSTDVLDVRYLGQPQSDAGYGWAVTIGKVGGQDTMAVGARGKGQSYVVWCTQLPGSPGGPRCRK